MLFLAFDDEMPTPTTLCPGDRIVVVRQLLKPMTVTIGIARLFGREEYFAAAGHMPQGERWPRRVSLLIGASVGRARLHVTLQIASGRSLTEQVTQELRRIDANLRAWKWRRIGRMPWFLHSAEFVAEDRVPA